MRLTLPLLRRTFLPLILAVAGGADLAQGEEQPIQGEPVVVTGSNLPLAGDAPSVPVTILSRTELERTGLSANLLDVLKKRMPMFGGSNNLGNTNAGTNASATGGGSQLALRNLSTLVLINGQRVSDNGLAGRGGRSFVDISQIPLAAIERVEVLADGASAIYGADAVGGVVNVILRSKFSGLETSGRYAFSSERGRYAERSVNVTGGGGNDRVSVVLSASWSKTDPLFQSEREFSSPMRGQTATIPGAIGAGLSFPSYLLNPALNSPRERNLTGTTATATSLEALVANGTYQPATFSDVAATFDVAPYTTLLLGRENRSASSSFTARLSGSRLEFYADALLTRSTSSSQVTPQFTLPNLTVPAGAPYNPLAVAFPQVAFRYLPAPRSIDLTGDLSHISAGLRGQISSDWTWRTGFTHSRQDSSLRVHNVFYAPNLARAVAGGYDAQGNPAAGGAYSRVRNGYSESNGAWTLQPALDPFARSAAVDPASLRNVLGDVFATFVGAINQLDATLTGTAIPLPAGSVHFAVGADFRREILTGQPDENLHNTGPTARRWVGAPFFDPFDRDRRIDAFFGEIRVPLAGEGWRARGLYSLDLNAAYRMEDYSDRGRSSVPRYGARWQPLGDRFTVRYTASRSFQAPTLYSLYGPVSQGFTATSVIPSVFGVNGAAIQQTGSNPQLEPAIATTRSFGVDWSPRAIDGLTLGADFASIHQRDVTGTLGAAAILQDVDARGPASDFAPQVALFAFPGQPAAVPISAAGQLQDWLVTRGNSANSVFVVDTQRNLAGQRVRTLDARLDYRLPSRAYGRWTVSSVATVFFDHQFQAQPLEPYYEYAGYATRGGTGSQGTIPRTRLYSSVGWEQGTWSVLLAHTFVSSVSAIGAGGATFASGTQTPMPVDAWSSFDTRVTWTIDASRFGDSGVLRRLTFMAGVNNLANQPPPKAPQRFDDNGSDISTYDPIGRLWYVGATMKF